jgi:bisphosphoglycerate-dependent phosphoglycerate mutase
VEGGLHGHDPQDVQAWRRSWYAVPPLLEEDDPRRRHECKVFANMCGGKENVPRGESLEMVARNRIRPFLEEKIHPILTQAAAPDSDIGACGLVVAHANSLRALIGVLCQVEKDASALRRLEALKIQTGVPLILQYRKLRNGSYQVCDIYRNGDDNYIDMQSLALTPDLPVWPLSCMPRESKKQQSLFGTGCSQGIRIDVI